MHIKLSSITQGVILMISLLSVSCKKQNLPETESTSVYGGSKDEFGLRIVASGDGNFIIAGRTMSTNGDIVGNHGNTDALIMKVDAQGKKIWQKCYGGLEDDEVNCVVATSDGGFVFAGYTNSNDQFVSSRHRNNEFWIFKTDKDGNLLWQKSYGGDGVDVALAVTETPDKGYAMSGFVTTPSSNNGDVGAVNNERDMWIVKVNQSGELVWQTVLGGSGDEYAAQIISTVGGTLTVVGVTNSTDRFATGSHGGSDAIVANLSDKGVLLWSLPIGGSGRDGGTDIVQNKDNSLVVVGSTSSLDGNFAGLLSENDDAFMARINAQHKIEWIRTFGGLGNDVAFAVLAASDGGYVFTGWTHSSSDRDVPATKGHLDLWTLKTNGEGIKIWSRTKGGSDNDEYGKGIAEVRGKGYIVVGSALSTDGDVVNNHGGADVMVSTFQSQ